MGRRPFSDVLPTDTTETLTQIRARIFGHHERQSQRTGRKALKRTWRTEEIAHYYPFPIVDPLLRDVELERYLHSYPHTLHATSVVLQEEETFDESSATRQEPSTKGPRQTGVGQNGQT